MHSDILKVNLIIALICIFLSSCSNKTANGTFGYDQHFLSEYLSLITLQENQGMSQVVVIPEYQGRVMTSTANGIEGNSYGWINYELIASQKFNTHINVFGGEDRFWIGPEGGQYAIFFKKGTEFTFENWYTPKEIDTEAFEIVSQSAKHVGFSKRMHLVNYQDFAFDIEVNREVTIFNDKEITKNLGINLSSKLNYVGYQSKNEIVNIGKTAWSKETGLLSVWILGMYMPSEKHNCDTPI